MLVLSEEKLEFKTSWSYVKILARDVILQNDVIDKYTDWPPNSYKISRTFLQSLWVPLINN